MLLTTVQTNRRNSRSATRRAAFTLLEVLIVVAILVILASAASIALFKYLEDAKVGRAKTDMRVIEQAYKKYYMDKGNWPESIEQIASELDSGPNGLVDPWQGRYTAQVVSQTQPDGTINQRPVITCTPQNRPPFSWPEK